MASVTTRSTIVRAFVEFIFDELGDGNGVCKMGDPITPHTGSGSTLPNHLGVEGQTADRRASDLFGLDIFQFVWRRRWLILAGGVIGLIVALVYVNQLPPIYVSSSRIYVERNGPRIMNDQGGVLSDSYNYLYTQAELLRSSPILQEAVASLKDRKLKSFSQTPNPVGLLRGKLQATVGIRDDLITVGIKWPVPGEAAIIVNEVVDAYIKFYGQKKQSTAAEVLAILQRAKGQREKDLAAKFKAMVDYKVQNEAIAIEGSKGDLAVTGYRKIAEALTAAQLERFEIEAQYKELAQVQSDPQKQSVYLSTYGSQLSDREHSQRALLIRDISSTNKELADLQVEATERHPNVLRLQRKLNQLDDQLAKANSELLAGHLELIRRKRDATIHKEQKITESLEAQRKVVLELKSQQANYALLEAEWQQTQKAVEILENRMKEINVDESGSVMNIYVLDVARPGGPQWPDRNSYMTRGLLLGLLAGIGLALLLERLNQKIRTVEELQSIIPMPVLGSVPEVSGKSSISDRGKWIDEHLFSPAAEAFRTLRTSIYFGLPKDQSKVILITSPLMGEGKSMVASNLGIAMAQSGHRTLIIDSDFRRPMQDQIFEVSKEIGLSTLVADRCELDEAVVASGIEGLDLLPIGPNPHNPTEILNSQAFAQIIQRLRQKYDNVIIDSPPVLPVADARILAALADVTLLVLRLGVSSNKPTAAAITALNSVGGRVLGAVANAIDDRQRNGYKYGYGYGYGNYSSQPGNGRQGSNGKDLEKSSSRSKPGGRPMIGGDVSQEMESDSEVRK